MCSRNYLIFLSMVIYLYLPASSSVVSLGSELIDVPCHTNADCQELIKGTSHKAECMTEQGSCRCFDEKDKRIECSVTNSPKASVINVVGGPCPCSIENTVCDEKEHRCVCHQNYTTSMDKRRCIIKILKLNDACEADDQCFKHDQFAKCDAVHKKCQCQENFIEHNGFCWSQINLGESCRVDNDCQNRTRHTVCKEQQCVCHRGFVAKKDNTECLPHADYGEKCIETSQCQKQLGIGSICENEICICDANHYNISMRENSPIGNRVMCERRILIGDTCMEHVQCYKFDINIHEQTMLCVNNECICRDNFQQIDKYCIKNVTDGVGFVTVSKQLKWLPVILIILSIIKCI